MGTLMTTQRGDDAEKPQLRLAVIVAAVVLTVAVLFGIGRQYMGPSNPSLALELDLDKNPIPARVVQDARQCEGDIAKLSPDEQQKIRAAYPGEGARIIISAAYATQR